MLQHEENTPQDVPAAQIRVTAEEFARAVARCQARREEAAQHLQGTVTIGEAARELGLEATPEEIYGEVQAGRAQQGRKAQGRSRRRLVWVSGGLIAGLFIGLWALALDRSATENESPVTVTAPVIPVNIASAISAPGNTLVLDKNQPKPRLDTLDNIPEDHPVRADLTATSDRVAFTNYSGSDVSWTLVKHEGHVYVRGWIADMSAAALRSSVVTIYTIKGGMPMGAAPLAVTLRLDRFRCDPSQSSDEIISAKNVLPDSHFTEAWPRR